MMAYSVALVSALIFSAMPASCDVAMDQNGDTGTPTSSAAPAGTSQTLQFRITGYGAVDNNPAGSSTISMPVLHQEAGGTGTFDDPLTAASPGHAATTDVAAGTKFYVAEIHRYVMVEDSGASKAPNGTDGHLDVWNGTAANAEDCEDKITGTFPVIENPPSGEPVTAGPIATGDGCNI